MANGNTVTIVGNITRDPELRYTPTGQSNTRFGVAVNRRWQDRNSGEWNEATSFFDVVCWREMAENVSESLGKGSRVLVTGRLEQRTYETKDGEKRNVVEIIADEVGPSLRWASAEVKKNDRRSGGDFGAGGSGAGGSGGAEGSSGGGAGGASGSSGRPQPAEAAVAPAGPGGYDEFGEEPF
jgi:single-strand DNA-binding protein